MLATWGCTTFPKPTLSLDFLGATSLDSGITFSRGSQATLFDSTGTLVYAKQNLLLQSQTFQTTWATNAASVSTDATAAPDGSLTADKLVEDATTAEHFIRQTSVPVSSSTSYTASAYIKAAERTTCRILCSTTGPSSGFVAGSYNLSAGTASGTGASIQSIGNGWYRCVLTVTSGASQTLMEYRVQLQTGSYAGDGTSGIFIWGAQLNATNMEGGVTSSLSTYYPTTTAAYYAPRFDYNPSTLQPRGLLIEEQRTNLEPNSEALTSVLGASILNNVATAPSGLVTADKLVEDTSTGAHQFATISVTWVGNTAYTFTIFLKADTRTQVQIAFGTSTNWVAGQRNAQFDVLNGTVLGTAGANVTASIEAVGNGWYRCRMTATTVAVPVGPSTIQIQMYVGGTASYTGDGTSGLFFWGAQIEAGSFPTSYIPTSGTTLTRNADVATMTGTNFSSWYNASEGTLFGEGAFLAISNSQSPYLVSIGDPSLAFASRNISASINRQASTANVSFRITSAGTNQLSVDVGSVAAATAFKSAIAYGTDNGAASLNGSVPTTDTSVTVPAVTTLILGDAGWSAPSGTKLNGWIGRIAYYPTRLPNATLQALTA